ncbi:MAG: hypothetical protein QW568_05395 [Candidatus Anstonellaceae archaeon]
MVFGLFEGNKIDIVLDKPSYKFGEEVTGKVIVALKKPKKAKGVRIQLYLQYETMRTVTRTSGRPPRTYQAQETQTERTAQQELTLDGEKEYPAGRFEYPFRFVCQNVQVAGFAQVDGWFLNASLDVPMSVDVSKAIRLNIM